MRDVLRRLVTTLERRRLKLNKAKNVMLPTTELDALGYRVGETVKPSKDKVKALQKL